MTSIASLGSAVSALPTGTRPHGHRKGSQVESTDDAISNSATAPVPATTQQNLFSSLLQSLKQVIGGHSSPPASAPAASSPAAGTSSSGTAAAKTAQPSPVAL